MGFYKPGANHTTDPAMGRMHKIIWTLIFGGLLTIILGIFVSKTDEAVGWIMLVSGSLLAIAGAVLIYVRSIITAKP